jgi:uncharacterized protein YggE
MKRILPAALSMLLLFVLLAAAGCDSITTPPGSSTRANAIGQQATGIWVTGQGKVTVTPDLALLVVGVEARGDTVAAAQADASAAMNGLMAALRNSGVAGEDIQTQRFRIDQRTRWDNVNDEEVVTGYQVTNTVTVKIRDIDSAGDIVDAAVEAGGDFIRISSFSFTVEDPAIYYDEAREKATADAKDKAEKLAEQNGVGLGDPTFIAEYTSTPYDYRSITLGLDSMAVPAPTIITTPTSAGEIDVTLTVQVAYSIE